MSLEDVKRDNKMFNILVRPFHSVRDECANLYILFEHLNFQSPWLFPVQDFDFI